MFFCKIIGGELQHGFDMQGVDFFTIDKLPELSEDCILKSQLKQLYQMVQENDHQTYFD